jgi:NB-ARC domain
VSNLPLYHVVDPVLTYGDDNSSSESKITARVDFGGHFSKSSLRPVANYVIRPRLQQKIEDQLYIFRGDVEQDTRILVIYGLGGSGKSQLALNFVRTRRRDYAAIFWIEAGRKETIERDYLSMYRLLFGSSSAGLKSATVEEAVMMVKSWFHGKSGHSLVILDSADTIDKADDASYVDLEYFLPDAPSVDVIITTRSSRAHFPAFNLVPLLY